MLICLSPVEGQSRKVKQAERRNEKQIKQHKKQYEKRRKATLKHRFEIQTEAVQKRMKETEARSRKYGRSQNEPFFKKLFTRKKRKRKKLRR